MSENTERDELAELLHDSISDSLPIDPSRAEIQQQVETAVDILIAAGYRKIDHTEYALDHKSSDLQFTDDDGELWTDEDDVKDYASEYGDSMTLVQRHVTAWEASL